MEKSDRELRIIAEWVEGNETRIQEIGSAAVRTMLTALREGKTPREAYALAQVAEALAGGAGLSVLVNHNRTITETRTHSQYTSYPLTSVPANDVNPDIAEPARFPDTAAACASPLPADTAASI